jgi:iron complex transport system ATP-binding protein
LVGIRIDGLTAGYGPNVVLRKITLQVRKGSICALIGPNGSGKTTLMRCINALLKPMEGRIFVLESDVSLLDRNRIARLISAVPQTSHAPFSFTCLEMILMGGAARVKAWASPGSKEIRIARRICSDMGIIHILSEPFNHLSGGQKQMIMLARALYQDAPVMLLDEPNSHLDFCNQHKMMELIRHVVKKRDATALITLHDPNLALQYCDQVIMLKAGRLITSGPVHETMQDDTLRLALGDNIRLDATIDGLPIVVPRDGVRQKFKKETGICVATIANGDVSWPETDSAYAAHTRRTKE